MSQLTEWARTATEHDTGGEGDSGADTATVWLTVPADGAYLGVLRTAAAGLAARLHFTLDEIEDLRIAVDEASAMLIRLTTPASPLECRFLVDAGQLGVELAVPATADVDPPATSSFAWKVLTSLATAVRAEITADGAVTIALVARRSPEEGR